MGLKVTDVTWRLERGVGLGGCLILVVPAVLVVKGIVLWRIFGWWHVGLLLAVVAAAAFMQLSRVLASWNTRFIHVEEGVAKVGRLEKGQEHVDVQLSCDDLLAVGLLKKGPHGAAYGLSAFLESDPPHQSELYRNGRIDEGVYDLLWWTQEYAGTVEKLLKAFNASGVEIVGEHDLASVGPAA